MSQQPLLTPSTPPGLHGMAALLYFAGTLLVGVLSFFGARYSATAPLQSALNDAFRSVTAELQAERAQLIARISELETEKLELRKERLERDGEIRGLKQSRDSLIALLMRSGIAVPGTEG